MLIINVVFALQSYILLDTEGTPAQELAAVEVDCATHAIVDVFHGYAYTEAEDAFARKHVHGLSQAYMKEFGFPSEASLIDAFKCWLDSKPYNHIFCNGADRERRGLALDIKEFTLLPWADRKNCASHQLAIRYKELTIPICGRRCTQRAHSCFHSVHVSPIASALSLKPAMVIIVHYMTLWNCILRASCSSCLPLLVFDSPDSLVPPMM